MQTTSAFSPALNSSISFDLKHKILCGALTFIFALALLFHLHGWSTPNWHNFIDGSPPTEILFGHARDIRSDDFLLDIPMILAQTAHQPSFPVINRNIGGGQYMLAPIKAPAKNFITLYRPFTWGFFLGNDLGLSWMWWGLTLGLFYSFFLVFMLVSRNLFWISFWAGFALVFSPYFQFWSLHKTEIAIHWAGAFVSAAYLLSTRKRWLIWCAGLALGWSIGGIALDNIYPPIAVSVAWLLPFAGAAWYWEHRKLLPWKEYRLDRAGAVVLAIIIVGVSLGAFFQESREFIQLIQNTTYPGRRFSSGGGYPLWAFFSHDFFAETCNHPGSWLGNICEDSSFIFVFPAIWCLLLILLIQYRKWLDPWSLILAIYVGGVMIYTYVGFPDWLAHLTLFGMSTINRTQMGLGLADLLMLVAALSNPRLRESLNFQARWISLLLWVSLLIVCGFWFKSHWPHLKLYWLFLGVGFQGLLAFLWWSKNLRSWGMALLALASFAYTFNFNPWVRGGSDYLFKNPLSTKILELDRSDQNIHQWVVIGDNGVSNLLRIIGVKSLGGYHGYPQFEIWKLFDPEGKYRPIYNQCAYMVFTPNASAETQFTSPSPGVVFVAANPSTLAFEKAGVRFFIAVGQPAMQIFEQSAGFNKVFSYADKAIYERKHENNRIL
jgi:hypothetical protein